jgi:hypothetical protein
MATRLIRNAPVPFFIKRAAIEGFLALTEELTVSDFSRLIAANVSLWRDIIPEEVKTILRDGAKQSLNSVWIGIAEPELAFEWILEARPELTHVLNNVHGKAWFIKTFYEIKNAVES